MSTQVHTFAWNDGLQNIKIEVLYFPLKFGVISHFEVRALNPRGAPLPITKTGYRSHFFHPESVDFSECGVVAFITDWLDTEAEKPDWKECVEVTRQYALF